MSSTFSLIGCGHYGSQNHSDALVSRIRKLTGGEVDKKPQRAHRQHHRTQHQQQPQQTIPELPTHFAFHNLDMDDPPVTDALRDLWYHIQRRKQGDSSTTSTVTTINTRNNNNNKKDSFKQIMWADCEGDQAIERIMLPLQLDLFETVVLYRISMEDDVFRSSITNTATSTMTTTTTTTPAIIAATASPTTTNTTTGIGVNCPQPSHSCPRHVLMIQDLSRNTTLKALRLEHCAPISLPVATLLGEGLFPSGHLETLSIKSCMLDHDTIPILAYGLQYAVSLKYLTLFWSNLWDDQVHDLILALLLQQQQQQLQFQSSSPLTLTTSSLCRLIELDLTGNICRAKSIEAVSKLLVPELYQNKPNQRRLESSKIGCLERLCLREQCIEVEKLPIGPLIEALQYNSSLIHLDLSVNKLDDSDMEYLGRALIGNRTLQELDIRSNQITDDGVESFTRQALLPVTANDDHKSNTTSPTLNMLGLRKLWLQDNPIGEAGAIVIRDALEVNFQLEYVGFGEYFGPISDEIEYYATLNWGGRRLLLLQSSSSTKQGSSIDTTDMASIALWPLVLERANRYAAMDRVANIVYYLLRGGPVLFHR